VKKKFLGHITVIFFETLKHNYQETAQNIEKPVLQKCLRITFHPYIYPRTPYHFFKKTSSSLYPSVQLPLSWPDPTFCNNMLTCRVKLKCSHRLLSSRVRRARRLYSRCRSRLRCSSLSSSGYWLRWSSTRFYMRGTRRLIKVQFHEIRPAEKERPGQEEATWR